MTKHILTTTVLFLGLAVTASAQNRSAADNLQDLRDIGVAVEYAQVDGLEGAKRPTILQRLQDRAKEQLTKAEVPLLKVADDADVTGRPRLVFVVTANKQTDTASAIIVETKLYERVRLWRDATKEMELATWVMQGIGGPVVTERMLFDVFDAQLNSFIRAYREANPKAVPADSTTASPPTQLAENTNGLNGLNGIRLFVSFRRDARPGADQRTELLKALQKGAETKLVAAGIPILTQAGESEKAGQPLLYLFITLSEPNYHRHPIEIESRFWQQVRPIRDLRKEAYVVTWESQANDGPMVTDEAVRRALNSQLDEFIKAYTTANPKPPAANVNAP
ncbi:MAG TPA: hypothetical protein VGJ37_15475 [Pyrinomonadaceae bacterium]